MRITWNELLVKPQGIDLVGLLDDWRWLVDESYQPYMLTALGDLFLQAADGRIFWLSTGWGELTEVAADADEFDQLRVQRDNANEWFQPSLVGDILTAGQQLGPGQCFSFIHPPALGGEFEVENFEPCDAQVHFSMLGQIHEQAKDLPPGTPIGEIKIVGDEDEDDEYRLQPE